VALGRAPSRLVHSEDRSIENAVAESLQSQCGEACPCLAWKDPAAAGTFVKKFGMTRES
jgi:hypothetical protein